MTVMSSAMVSIFTQPGSDTMGRPMVADSLLLRTTRLASTISILSKDARILSYTGIPTSALLLVVVVRLRSLGGEPTLTKVERRNLK